MKNIIKGISLIFISLFCSVVLAETSSSTMTTGTDATSMQPTTTSGAMTDKDTTLTNDINSKLSQSTTLTGSSITATTKKGVVTLNGTVETKAQIKEAIKITKSVTGVKKVKSAIKVSKNKSTTASSN